MLWSELSRTQLRDVLPEALVVVPIGAIEQHGPHLPTWTDTLIVSTVVGRAVGDDDRYVVTPTVAFGASDHHLPFGGTLSLSVETLQTVLLDLARSIAADGGRRVAFVNGHGGNRGACRSAAAAASIRYDVAVGYTDYWSLWQPSDDGPRWPGHAGRFETSLIQAIRPDLVRSAPHRDPAPSPIESDGWDVHSERSWLGMDGFTDDPSAATAADGAKWLDALVAALAERLAELASTL
jgi:creatinine amidohydrolase